MRDSMIAKIRGILDVFSFVIPKMIHSKTKSCFLHCQLLANPFRPRAPSPGNDLGREGQPTERRCGEDWDSGHRGSKETLHAIGNVSESM
jgi:hypothetical protein